MAKSKHKKPEPQKWTEVYPYGTPEGDEEAKFFKCLARHPKFDSQSTAAIIKATGLTRERIEEIIDKYATQIKPPLVYPHPTNEDQWCYWESCPEVLDGDTRDLSTKDKDSRIDNYLNGTKGIQSMEIGSLVNPAYTLDAVEFSVPEASVPESLTFDADTECVPSEINFPRIVLTTPATGSGPTLSVSYTCYYS